VQFDAVAEECHLELDAFVRLALIRNRTKETELEGTMLWFNPEKHHGFIRTDDGERLRVDDGGFADGHALGDRCRGTRVSFDRLDVDEPRAVNVEVIPLFAARRARTHGWR
jgi:hypothetical protein